MVPFHSVSQRKTRSSAVVFDVALAVRLLFSSKTLPCIFLAEMFLFCFVLFIVHALIFCPCFSQKQSANQPKKYKAMFKYLIDKHNAKIQALFKGKKIHLKKSFSSVLHQAIQLFNFQLIIRIYETQNSSFSKFSILTLFTFSHCKCCSTFI